MDTVFTITIYSDLPETAEKAAAKAFSEIKRIESKLDIYNKNSELSKLNKNGTLLSPSRDLFVNIEKSLYYSDLSNGAFDITVQPILDLYKKSFSERNSPPTDEMIIKQLKKVDYKNIKINNNKITIGRGQRLTLGGIAKGYAVEKAVEILKACNIKMALVDAGGNIRALGKKPDGVWNIAIRDPRNKNNYITIIPLENNAVSTSGDYERFFNPDKKFHHIINPKTGYSAIELISATIVADNAFDADAASTTVFVLGKTKGMGLIESLPNVEGLIITKERDICRSSGFKESKQ
ncbi:MAG: FAD:protein FMN transferase [Spirochaetales bacterium]|nr:FAD:protein FMN transferase [Spirochaetales bacterium]